MKVNFIKLPTGILRDLQDKQTWNTNIRPLIGLLGVLVAALSADLNEFVSGAALIDVRGALGISTDPGRWIDSLYVTGPALGMAFAPWSAVTFTLRRFTLFAIGLACAATTLLAVVPNLQAIMILRLIQGLSGGLTIPLLMTTALRVLPPAIRLYGLAIYALTITFLPNISISFVAMWIDVVHDWHLVFLQAIPLEAVPAALVWYGLPHDVPRYERLRQFDWRGALLIVVGVGSLTSAVAPRRPRGLVQLTDNQSSRAREYSRFPIADPKRVAIRCRCSSCRCSVDGTSLMALLDWFSSSTSV